MEKGWLLVNLKVLVVYERINIIDNATNVRGNTNKVHQNLQTKKSHFKITANNHTTCDKQQLIYMQLVQVMLQKWRMKL